MFFSTTIENYIELQATLRDLIKNKKEQFLNEGFVNSILKSWHKATKYSVPVCRLLQRVLADTKKADPIGLEPTT